ncbi:uncharacterized protein LOC129002401 [Macrosteles quadrilineatus]|uniref:uncharacterized protein LOC129002401 n=1 Tax=Macrosteles quadrilineatus TaxID=74068 RepID=UPI0023E09568|nr:uncharacterized protein LOC129002401 [Macrosteles quadrilineatus]
MIRLVLVSSFIFILGSCEAKSALNDLPLKNVETRIPYRSIEEKQGVKEGAVIIAGSVVTTMFLPYIAVGFLGYYVGRRVTTAATEYAVGKAKEVVTSSIENVIQKSLTGE